MGEGGDASDDGNGTVIGGLEVRDGKASAFKAVCSDLSSLCLYPSQYGMFDGIDEVHTCTRCAL